MRRTMRELEELVDKFRMLELPGQPRMMHMGTGNLVNDLWEKVKELSDAVAAVETMDHERRLQDRLEAERNEE